MQAVDLPTSTVDDEQGRVEMRRATEALDAGLPEHEAWLFARNGCDIGLLRRLVEQKCPVQYLTRLIT